MVAGGAVVVLAAAAGGGYLLWGGGKPAPAHAAHHATSSSGLPTAPATATDATGPTAATDVPTDYRLVHDQAGFTLAVPRDWQRTERANGVFYTAPDQHGLVQIFQDQHPTETPREALEKTSQQLSHSAANPNYEEVSLAPLTDQAPGADAVQLIYAYDSKDVGERVKVVDCAFTATDGRQFAVLVRGTDAEWPHQEDIQRIALRTFAATG
ncbi:hypothetical protein B1H19_25220 [Streptomyces gilvosporeus]|uniref:Serine/arginine repetitive matrix protein 2 n=1 Tax=Streptomyces gilvosporeus TaxID=553510 RepID=A0A1V0U3V6_9ACTN|nr:hypothetical protein B1H19_25220 [Streptomyces gilvosporeus]